jgi:site-specific recombinase
MVMASHLELRLRALLCRQLARREPRSRIYWLAEAENWLRLAGKSADGVREGGRDSFEQLLNLIDDVPEAS